MDGFRRSTDKCAIGGACLLLSRLAGLPTSPASEMCFCLGYINLGLAGFNLIPGYPLDGGRIVRAALWWKNGNVEQATRQAARMGQGVGTLFIALGIVRFFAGAGLGGLWIAFIGWFLLQAAGESIFQTGLTHALEGTTVADVMSNECSAVDGNLNVENFVEQHLLHTGDRCFIVLDNSGLAGLVTPQEVKTLDRARWPYTTVYDIMRPIGELRTVKPEMPLETALEIMSRENVNQLPVVKYGHLEGVLTRARLLHFIHNRLELQS